MSSEIPDEWFRPAGDDAAVAGGDPVGGGPGSAADERYTDQFKPGRATPRERHQVLSPHRTSPAGAGTASAGTTPTSTGSGASHSVGVDPDRTPPPPTRRRRPGLRLLGAVLGLAALAGAGAVVGDRLLGRAPTTTTTDPQLVETSGAASTPSPPAVTATPWGGPVRTVAATSVAATCTAPTQTGYDGLPVSSEASRVLDGDLATGWRCDGDGQGQGLTFTFPPGTELVGVRMTNGYTKSVQGTSLYGQYRRVTTATWTFGGTGGAYFLQNLADDRPSLQEIRIPETPADGGLQLQVASATAPGGKQDSRNAVIITEVQFLVRKG